MSVTIYSIGAQSLDRWDCAIDHSTFILFLVLIGEIFKHACVNLEYRDYWIVIFAALHLLAKQLWSFQRIEKLTECKDVHREQCQVSMAYENKRWTVKLTLCYVRWKAKQHNAQDCTLNVSVWPFLSALNRGRVSVYRLYWSYSRSVIYKKHSLACLTKGTCTFICRRTKAKFFKEIYY